MKAYCAIGFIDTNLDGQEQTFWNDQCGHVCDAECFADIVKMLLESSDEEKKVNHATNTRVGFVIWTPEEDDVVNVDAFLFDWIKSEEAQIDEDRT